MIHSVLERCVPQVVNRPGRTESGTGGTYHGEQSRQRPGLVGGYSEPSSRCYPPLRRGLNWPLNGVTR